MSFFAPQTYHLPKMRKAYMLKRSKKMMFPNSLHFDIKDKIFGTDDLSPLFSVINTKKEPDSGSDCEMVIPEGERILLRKILYLRASPRKSRNASIASFSLGSYFGANPRVLPPSESPLKDKQKIPYGHFQFILW